MKTILLVDDDPQLRTVFDLALSKHGYHVIVADSGSSALALARQHLPDLILTDIHMPGGDGSTLLQDIRHDPELRSIPVVAVTAFAMKGDEERIREGGCEAYLSKPISVGKFIETVRRFIG